MMAQTLLVDPHPIVRKAIKQVLQTAFPFLGVKEFADGNDVVREICAYPWALVIMDINLPGQNGIEIIKKAKASCPMTPVLVFGTYSERRYAARAYRAGAIAYLSKDCSLDHFINTVRTVLDKRQPQKRRDDTRSKSTVLPDREVQVLRLFVKGLSRKEIARALKIKDRTVSTYKTKLIEKLDLRSFAELIHYAIEEGIN
jgi:DNA-binding NarL/FixJ family response regulator